MALDRKKLEKFFKRNLLSGVDDNPICRITMRHAMGGSKAATVLDQEVTPHHSAVELTSQFEESATDDAEGLGGLQSYVISTYFTAVPDKVRERFSFRLHVPSESDDEIDNTESATQAGLTAQLMRHNEANARVMTMSMGEVMRQMNRMNERLATQNENLMDKHFSVLELYEKLMTAETTREIDKMKVTSKIAREDQLVEKALLLAPAVVNRLTGKAMLPEKATPAEMMVMDFAKSLKPDQMMGILGLLEPAQQLQLMELMENQRRRDEADAKKDKE